MSLEDLTPAQRAHLALGASLMGNPETADDARRLLRKADPKFRAPDLEIQDRLDKEREERKAENKALEEKLDQDKRDRWYAEQQKKVAAAGLDMTALEKTMTERKIADYDTAIEFMQSKQSVAAPTFDSVAPMQMPDSKELWQDPKKTASKIAHEMISEFRAKRTA